jgi:hypothetical protein
MVSRRSDYRERYPEAFRDLGKWISEGRIIRKFQIFEGLERAPEVYPLLFTGDNTGKLFVLPSHSPNVAALTPRISESFVFLGSHAKI